MSTRTKTQTVTFTRPFRVRRTDRELRAGDYRIETDEEPIEGISALSYQRVEVRLFVPRIDGVSDAEMWVLGVREFDAALQADQAAPASPLLKNSMVTETRPVFPRTEPSERRDHARGQDKGANTPLYGTLLGVLALTIAGAVLGRMNPASPSAHGSATQVTDTRE